MITGATGMIGSGLAEYALSQGLDVLCIVKEQSARLACLPPAAKKIYYNLEDYQYLTPAGEYDVLFHLAWDNSYGALREDVEAQAKNIRYTLDAACLAKRLGCTKFVGVGSQSEYGLVTRPLKIDTPAHPVSAYGIAKYSAGRLSALLCSQLGMAFNWVRILSVYGPYDRPHTLIMYAIQELQNGKAPSLTKCEQTWDYLYSRDAARALLAIAGKGADGSFYPLGSGSPRLLSGYLESLKNIVNPRGTLCFGEKDYYPNQPLYLTADISELTRDTGWKPEVSFEDGIREILAWSDPLNP